MYNIIDIGRNCPNCGAKVEWQSKELMIDDIYPVMETLANYKLDKRMSGEVHTSCDKCGVWLEVRFSKGKLGKVKVEIKDEK